MGVSALELEDIFEEICQGSIYVSGGVWHCLLWQTSVGKSPIWIIYDVIMVVMVMVNLSVLPFLLFLYMHMLHSPQKYFFLYVSNLWVFLYTTVTMGTIVFFSFRPTLTTGSR